MYSLIVSNIFTVMMGFSPERFLGGTWVSLMKNLMQVQKNGVHGYDAAKTNIFLRK